MAIHPIASGTHDGLPIPPALLHELRQALRSIRYGTIEIVIHDGRVVQLERREKIASSMELRSPSRRPDNVLRVACTGAPSSG